MGKSLVSRYKETDEKEEIIVVSSKTLKPFQERGRDFLKAREFAFLADEVGTGKTVQALTAIEDYPALIVCNNSAKYFWRSEIYDWLGASPDDVYVYEPWDRYDSTTPMFHKPFNIIHWEGLRYVEDRLGRVRWGTGIIDEVHRGKNRKSKQSDIIRHVRPRRRYALSGTPMVSTPEDLWAPLNYLDRKTYSSYWRFFHQHVLAIPRFVGQRQIGYDVMGVRDRNALIRELQPFMIRRLRKKVLPELPPEITTVRNIKLDPDQHKVYEQMRKEFILQLESGEELTAPTVLAQMTRLRQITDGVFLLDPNSKVPSTKLNAVVELAEEYGDQPLVIFTQFVPMAKAIADALPNAQVITGDTDSAERENLRQRFQDGDIRVLVLTLGVGSESITLTAANTAVFVDSPWTPKDWIQATGRLQRMTQEADHVQYIKLIASGTVDEHVESVLANKEFMLDQIFHRSDWRGELKDLV